MTTRSTMKIGALLNDVGIHPAAWLHPSTVLGGEVSLPFYLNLAQTAEKGRLDFIFLADAHASRWGSLDGIMRQATHIAHFEPITLMSALAAGTRNIGLAATISASYSDPYTVARQFASLDHISAGRSAWNVVTTADPAAALNFSRNAHEEHDRRYERANEFIDVVNGLWDSWDDEAFVRDRDAGVFFDPAKRYPLNHIGEFYRVKGPLNVPRPPQGRPVAISAGGSEPGRDLAARTSEVVFSVDRDIQQAAAFYKDIKARAARYGRSADQIHILTALNPIVGETDAQAQEKLYSLQSRIHPSVGKLILSVDLGVDLEPLNVDEPIPEGFLPETSDRTRSYFDKLRDAVADEQPTIRELYERHAASRGGMNAIVGSPTTIADRMEEWFTHGATDGYMVRISHLPEGLTDFVTLVIPELQRRGLFRREYTGSTLRDHLTLERPRRGE